MGVKCFLRDATGVFMSKGIARPSVIDAGRIDASDFVELVECNRNVPRSAVLAALSGAASQMYALLRMGHSVEVPGFGVFMPEVKGRVAEDGKGRKVLENVKLTARLVPEPNERREMKNTPVKLVSHQVMACDSLSEEQAIAAARNLIADKGFFTQQQMAQAMHVSVSTANRVLNKLTEQGLLGYEQIGTVYVYNRVTA